MQREVIFMLSGYGGSIFTTRDDGPFEICPGVGFLSPSERETLKPLLRIGSIVSSLTKFSEDGKPESFYLSAIKSAIRNCLTEFQETLLELEEEILDGSSSLLGVTGIHARVLPYSLLLEYLKAFVDIIKLQQKNGCLLIDTVEQHRNHCGVQVVVGAFQQILNECLKVLHKQLISWLVFGKLLDPHGEFFISHDEESSSKQPTLNAEKIPSCLNATLAQQVLFVGESVLALSQSQDVSEEDWVFMAQLQKTPFDRPAELIQKCRDHTARKLWSQVTEKGRLQRSLSVIRSTFLMKKGDVFVYFIRQIKTILDRKLQQESQSQQVSAGFLSLQQKFASCLKKYYVEDEAEIERLSIQLMPEVQGTGWDRIAMEYRSEWPLGVLVFTPDTMRIYNQIFQLLLKLRRIQLDLNGLWANQKKVQLDPSVLELRWNLQHVLTHLSQYVHTDVVEVQISIMDRQIHQCEDFDKFRAAHANFLAVVASQAFLHVPAMQACFKDFMDLASKFCSLMGEKEEPDSATISAVAELNLEFERLMQLLFSLLNGMYKQSSGAFSMEPIAQLLLRLDFNHYLSEGLEKKKCV